ncbi:hypothetical protein NHX12_032022 [Muraenolepis orangiensis]|uniref:Uncharacterized protein n=1 Tax=Muraenolepis orangiensis TaxID=630683 RepID=A0A9Q0E6P3_9TELE|nr:hypothetical protein NHX12_032022 [Muraenolepis orangiensis]
MAPAAILFLSQRQRFQRVSVAALWETISSFCVKRDGADSVLADSRRLGEDKRMGTGDFNMQSRASVSRVFSGRPDPSLSKDSLESGLWSNATWRGAGRVCGSFLSVVTCPHAAQSVQILLRTPKERQQKDRQSAVTVVTDSAVRTPPKNRCKHNRSPNLDGAGVCLRGNGLIRTRRREEYLGIN